MMKTLRFFMMSALMLVAGSMFAQQAVTIAEFNAAAESTDVWYQLTGTVSNLKDGDLYGNFDLTDETGTVYVYGLLTEQGGAKKKFQELAAAKGITNGCKLTLIGNRGSYNNKIEVLNAYFVAVEGGDETPTSDVQKITVAKALEIINALDNGGKTTEVYEIEGFVVSIDEVFNPQYGNYTFQMGDATTSTDCLTAFRVKNADNEKFTEDVLNVGDKVVVKGQLQKYVNKSEQVIPETYNGVILTINGTPTAGGETPDPETQKITVAKALEIINALDNGGKTTEVYEIEGFVVSIDEVFNPQYGNYTFQMGDATTSTDCLTAFRVKNADNEKFTEDVLNVGDKVVVKGQLQKYVNKSEQVIPETYNGVILTINGNSTAGINNVKAGNAQVVRMYNIAGQVVNNGYKGLVIMNGRKYMNK